jgi:hypothetical protein
MLRISAEEMTALRAKLEDSPDENRVFQVTDVYGSFAFVWMSSIISIYNSTPESRRAANEHQEQLDVDAKAARREFRSRLPWEPDPD